MMGCLWFSVLFVSWFKDRLLLSFGLIVGSYKIKRFSAVSVHLAFGVFSIYDQINLFEFRFPSLGYHNSQVLAVH